MSWRHAMLDDVPDGLPLARLTAEDLHMELDELFEFGLAGLLDGMVDLRARPGGSFSLYLTGTPGEGVADAGVARPGTGRGRGHCEHTDRVSPGARTIP
jgi:hypothetical protein